MVETPKNWIWYQLMQHLVNQLVQTTPLSIKLLVYPHIPDQPIDRDREAALIPTSITTHPGFSHSPPPRLWKQHESKSPHVPIWTSRILTLQPTESMDSMACSCTLDPCHNIHRSKHSKPIRRPRTYSAFPRAAMTSNSQLYYRACHIISGHVMIPPFLS